MQKRGYRMQFLKKLERWFVRIVEILLIVIFSAMILIVGAQVIIRFVAANAINMSGTEEITRFLLCYLTFLGTTLLYEEKGHVWVANLVDSVPAPLRKVMLLLSYIVQFAFFVSLFIGAKKIFPVLATQKSNVTHIPLNIVYIGIPLMAAFCIVFCVRDFIMIAMGKEEQNG